MSPRTVLRMARPIRARIGAHDRLAPGVDYDVYLRAQADSLESVSLAKYLIQHLDSRADAVLFARAVGMPGYIHLR